MGGQDHVFNVGLAVIVALMLGVTSTAFGANGVLFGFYHLHTPWSIPAALADIILTS